MAGKYYWLKLKEDFFESNDIQVVESMPSGKDFIIFYLKLLCKSISHEGNLLLTEEIPYSEEMLATITHTDINVVKQAISIFTGLGMMEKLDSGTFFMNKVQNMIGSAANNENAIRQQRFRDRQKQALIAERYDSVTKNNERIEIRDKRLEIRDKSKDNNKRFTPPTQDEIAEYCKERNNNIDAEAFYDYYNAQGWVLSSGQKMKDWKSAVRNWERRDKNKKPKQVEDDFDWGGIL